MVLAAAQISLQVAALKDLKKRPAAQVNGPMAAWVAGSFINFVGPIAYFMIGRKK
ncbi:MAG TPA: PLDc N-terminal domain-containing protein [Micrococcaceae bacterium]